MYEDYKKNILKLIKNNSNGITIQDVANELGHNRITMSKILDVMIAEGTIRMIKKGSLRLHYINGVEGKGKHSVSGNETIRPAGGL